MYICTPYHRLKESDLLFKVIRKNVLDSFSFESIDENTDTMIKTQDSDEVFKDGYKSDLLTLENLKTNTTTQFQIRDCDIREIVSINNKSYAVISYYKKDSYDNEERILTCITNKNLENIYTNTEFWDNYYTTYTENSYHFGILKDNILPVYIQVIIPATDTIERRHFYYKLYLDTFTNKVISSTKSSEANTVYQFYNIKDKTIIFNNTSELQTADSSIEEKVLGAILDDVKSSATRSDYFKILSDYIVKINIHYSSRTGAMTDKRLYSISFNTGEKYIGSSILQIPGVNLYSGIIPVQIRDKLFIILYESYSSSTSITVWDFFNKRAYRKSFIELDGKISYNNTERYIYFFNSTTKIIYKVNTMRLVKDICKEENLISTLT